MRIGSVTISGGALLLAAWLNYLDRQGLFLPALLACGLHEAGHYAVLRWLQNDITEIRITISGAEMAVRDPMSYGKELLAALGGPAVNVLLALVFCRWAWGAVFAGLNWALAWFNLLPVGNLDGGRALRCILSCTLGPQRTDRVTLWLDGLLLSLLLAAALLLARGGNLTLLLTAGWLLLHFLRERSAEGLSSPLPHKKLRRTDGVP